MSLKDPHDLKDVFARQSAAHKKAREDFLSNAISTAATWITQMTDPEMDNAGRDFLAQAAKTGCTEKIDIFHAGLAHYCSYSYAPRGFLNQITYGPAAEDSLPRLYSAKVHETTHALQKMNCPALHASPFNADTNIIICPRDWMLLEERCEQDAYTKQALFNSLLARFVPEMQDLTGADALSVPEFDRVRLECADITQTLRSAAQIALDKSFYWDNPDAEYRFRHACQDQALRNYDSGLATRKNNGEKDFVFVRVEPDDIAAIGASFGPNVFCDDTGLKPAFLTPSPPLPATRRKLDELNSACGITDTDALPTLREALSQISLSREEFLARAYRDEKSPAPPPCGPQAPAP